MDFDDSKVVEATLVRPSTAVESQQLATSAERFFFSFFPFFPLPLVSLLFSPPRHPCRHRLVNLAGKGVQISIFLSSSWEHKQ